MINLTIITLSNRISSLICKITNLNMMIQVSTRLMLKTKISSETWSPQNSSIVIHTLYTTSTTNTNTIITFKFCISQW